MVKFNLLFLVLFSVFIAQSAFSQEFVGGGNADFSWRLIGRVFFDGGVLNPDSTQTSFQVNDIRLGTLIRFQERWEAKIELGYGDSKISLKDVFLNYTAGSHAICLGYRFEPFGNARVGTSNYRFMTESSAERALGNKRKLGVSYSYNQKSLNVMAGVFSDGDIEKSKLLNQGYSLAGKLVGRPLTGNKKLIHIGVAPRFSSSSKEVAFAAGAPTDLLAKDDNKVVSVKVDQVINQWKLDMELILLYNKWYFQGQYFQTHLNRFAASNYNAKGGYMQAGYMILGEKHNYNPATAMIVNPAPKSLEVLFRYDKVNLNDIGFSGQKMSDISLGMNYFINKFVAAKVNYTYVMPEKNTVTGVGDYSVVQARVQFNF